MLKNYRRLDPSKYTDAPEWFYEVADSLNKTLREIVETLQGNITTDNERAEVVELSLTHETLQVVSHPKVRASVEEVRPIWSATALTGFYWAQNDSSSVIVRVWFRGAPTEPQHVRLKIRGS